MSAPTNIEAAPCPPNLQSWLRACIVDAITENRAGVHTKKNKMPVHKNPVVKSMSAVLKIGNSA